MSIVKKIKISDRRTDREYLLSGKSKSEEGERNDNKKEMGGYQMPVYTYEVVGIHGDYAHLRRKDIETEETKLVARALLPPEIMEGSILKYEMLEYTIIG
mgnify:FL=1